MTDSTLTSLKLRGDAFIAKRRRQLVVAALVFAAVACLPLGIRDVYLQNVLILTLLYAAVSQSGRCWGWASAS